jgi:glycosyltransferase 2 family protein
LKSKGLFGTLSSSEKDGTSTRFSRLMILVSILLAFFFLYLALRNLDWQIFFNTIKNAQYVYLPLVFLWGSISYLFRALRLRIPLASEKYMPVSNVFWANMAGYLGNNILPARAGELVRAAYLARQNKISSSFALAVGLLERLMDLIALIVLGSFALSSIGVVSSVFQNALRIVSFLGLFGLVAVFVLPSFGHLAGRLIMGFPALGETSKLKLNILLQQFLGGLKSLHGFTRIVQFVSITGLIWMIDAFGTVLLAYILKIPLLFQQAFVLLAALGLSSAIPSTPGYVGVYQFVAVTTLAPFGVSQADALAYILVSQVINFLVIGFWGLISLWQFNKPSTQEA